MDEQPSLTLVERDLSWLRFDYEIQLRFGDAEVRLSGAFRLTLDGRDYDLHPAHHADLGPVLRLFPGACESLVVESDGTLRLTFESGHAITAPPDERFEAWAVAGAGPHLVVCAPGGAVAVFD